MAQFIICYLRYSKHNNYECQQQYRICIIQLQEYIKMEWKKSKSIKLKAKLSKSKIGLNRTLNTIPVQNIKQKTHHHKVFTQGRQSGLQSQTFSSTFEKTVKENYIKREEDCSTYANSIYSFYAQHNLSKQFTKIGLEFQHENERLKTFLATIPKRCSIQSVHNPIVRLNKQSLSAKINYQNSLLKSMGSLGQYR